MTHPTKTELHARLDQIIAICDLITGDAAPEIQQANRLIGLLTIELDGYKRNAIHRAMVQP